MPFYGEFDFEYYTDDSGIVRWKSNDSVPPADCLDEMDISDATKLRSLKVGRIEEAEAIKAYKERMKNHVYSEEALAEMRAEFGEGETVINVITGEEIKL